MMAESTNGRRRLFSGGFPTNRIPLTIPSTGQNIILRETTVVELKSLAKTIIDNLGRKQMDVIYDAVSEYLQKMVLSGDVDVWRLTELDRLYCLMVFFQMSFYKDPTDMKCPHCGVDIKYRYDLVRYIAKIPSTYVDCQIAKISYKSRRYVFNVEWPTVKTMSMLYHHFYGGSMGEITDEMERTQLGINFILAFVKKVAIYGILDEDMENPEAEIEFTDEMQFGDRLDCLNSLPSVVMFDEKDGLFSQIMGYFVNRLENCFGYEICPQCHRETDFGIPHSSIFHGMFYGSLKSLYGFILQVECLMVFKYGCCIFNDENYMTFNDLTSLVKQIGVTAEKDNHERQKMGKDSFGKGLWYIREILNNMIFPEYGKNRNR